MDNLPDPTTLILFLAALSMVPFAVVMVTSFAKIAIVLFLIRNALGIQQVPPNIVLYGLSLILTIYIMAPVGNAAIQEVQAADIDLSDTAGLTDGVRAAAEPIRAFLDKHTQPEQRSFFVDATNRLWPEDMRGSIGPDDLIVLIPSFTMAELTRAFEIGFLLYLPFIAIDLIVSNILLAMGMMMVSPMTISLPFKLFLFVLVDGWTRLIHGLILSYA